MKGNSFPVLKQIVLKHKEKVCPPFQHLIFNENFRPNKRMKFENHNLIFSQENGRPLSIVGHI